MADSSPAPLVTGENPHEENKTKVALDELVSSLEKQLIENGVNKRLSHPLSLIIKAENYKHFSALLKQQLENGGSADEINVSAAVSWATQVANSDTPYHVVTSLLWENARKLARTDLSHDTMDLQLEMVNEALDFARRVLFSNDWIATLHGLSGDIYLAACKYVEALQCYELDYSYSSQLPNLEESTILVRPLTGLGCVHLARGRLKKAKSFFTRALSIMDTYDAHCMERRKGAREDGVPPSARERMAVCSHLGRVYMLMGDSEMALQYHYNSGHLANVVGDRKMYCTMCSGVGSVYQALGQYTKALEMHQEHHRLCAELKDLQGQMVAIGNAGACHHAMGFYKKSLMCHETQLQLAVQMEDKRNMCSGYGGCGTAKLSLGDQREAVLSHQKALQLAKEVGDRVLMSTCAHNLGNSLMASHRPKEAIEHFETFYNFTKESVQEPGIQGIDDSESTGPNPDDVLAACNSLGGAHAAIGNMEVALQYYEEGIQHAEGNQRGIAQCFLNMAGAFVTNPEFFEDAKRFYMRAVDGFTKTNDLSGIALAHGGMATVCFKEGRFDDAIENSKEDLRISVQLEDEMGEARGCRNLGLAYQQRGDFESALNYHERHRQLSSRKRDFRGQSTAEYDCGISCQSLGFLERARLYLVGSLRGTLVLRALKHIPAGARALVRNDILAKDYSTALRTIDGFLNGMGAAAELVRSATAERENGTAVGTAGAEKAADVSVLVRAMDLEGAGSPFKDLQAMLDVDASKDPPMLTLTVDPREFQSKNWRDFSVSDRLHVANMWRQACAAWFSVISAPLKKDVPTPETASIPTAAVKPLLDLCFRTCKGALHVAQAHTDRELELLSYGILSELSMYVLLDTETRKRAGVDNTNSQESVSYSTSERKTLKTDALEYLQAQLKLAEELNDIGEMVSATSALGDYYAYLSFDYGTAKRYSSRAAMLAADPCSGIDSSVQKKLANIAKRFANPPGTKSTRRE